MNMTTEQVLHELNVRGQAGYRPAPALIGPPFTAPRHLPSSRLVCGASIDNILSGIEEQMARVEHGAVALVTLPVLDMSFWPSGRSVAPAIGHSFEPVIVWLEGENRGPTVDLRRAWDRFMSSLTLGWACEPPATEPGNVHGAAIDAHEMVRARANLVTNMTAFVDAAWKIVAARGAGWSNAMFVLPIADRRRRADQLDELVVLTHHLRHPRLAFVVSVAER
jgi:hypothetical protein